MKSINPKETLSRFLGWFQQKFKDPEKTKTEGFKHGKVSSVFPFSTSLWFETRREDMAENEKTAVFLENKRSNLLDSSTEERATTRPESVGGLAPEPAYDSGCPNERGPDTSGTYIRMPKALFRPWGDKANPPEMTDSGAFTLSKEPEPAQSPHPATSFLANSNAQPIARGRQLEPSVAHPSAKAPRARAFGSSSHPTTLQNANSGGVGSAQLLKASNSAGQGSLSAGQDHADSATRKVALFSYLWQNRSAGPAPNSPEERRQTPLSRKLVGATATTLEQPSYLSAESANKIKGKDSSFVPPLPKGRKTTPLPSDGVKQQVVSITYEEIGLFPRSFNRVFDRFFKQLFFDVENLVIQEYRFYRYLFLTTVKCLFILIFVPFIVNLISKNYLVRPITEYYWNSKQPEIFLNSFQQKRAFNELKDFQEKIYFESLLVTSPALKTGESSFAAGSSVHPARKLDSSEIDSSSPKAPDSRPWPWLLPRQEQKASANNSEVVTRPRSAMSNFHPDAEPLFDGVVNPTSVNLLPLLSSETSEKIALRGIGEKTDLESLGSPLSLSTAYPTARTGSTSLLLPPARLVPTPSADSSDQPSSHSTSWLRQTLDRSRDQGAWVGGFGYPAPARSTDDAAPKPVGFGSDVMPKEATSSLSRSSAPRGRATVLYALFEGQQETNLGLGKDFHTSLVSQAQNPPAPVERKKTVLDVLGVGSLVDKGTNANEKHINPGHSVSREGPKLGVLAKNSQTLEESIQKCLQAKTIELAHHYNEESIEAITNFFADLISFSTFCFLLVNLEIQINITKSFLLEVFFGLDDSKKSLLILFVTDLLVGYHSPNIWELFFSSFFDHYGLPESQTTIFLLVATLPVLLDVLFKYLIFRHLNRASPATVATYHAMIE